MQEIDLETLMLRLRGEQALKDAPAVMRGAHAAVVRGGAARMDGMPRAPQSSPVLPFNEDAVAALDGIYSTLLNWAAELATYLELPPTPLAIPYIARDHEAKRAPALPISAVVGMTTTITEWLLAADNAIAGTGKIAARYWRDVAEHVESARKAFVPDPKVRAHPVFASRDCPACDQRRTVIVNVVDELQCPACSSWCFVTEEFLEQAMFIGCPVCDVSYCSYGRGPKRRREISCACTYCGFVIPHELTPRWLRKESWRWGAAR